MIVNDDGRSACAIAIGDGCDNDSDGKDGNHVPGGDSGSSSGVGGQSSGSDAMI